MITKYYTLTCDFCSHVTKVKEEGSGFNAEHTVEISRQHGAWILPLDLCADCKRMVTVEKLLEKVDKEFKGVGKREGG